MDNGNTLHSSGAAHSVDTLNQSKIKDLDIQQDDHSPDQSTLANDSGQHAVKLTDQSNGVDSLAESQQGMMDQSEEGSSKDIDTLTNSKHQSCTNINHTESVSVNGSDDQSTLGNDNAKCVGRQNSDSLVLENTVNNTFADHIIGNEDFGLQEENHRHILNGRYDTDDDDDDDDNDDRQREVLVHPTVHALRYESDSENKSANSTSNSHLQSPRFIRPISPGFRPSTPPIKSNQSGPSIQVTSQSGGSSSSPNRTGVNQDELNGGGSETSYQRDERSKSPSEEEEASKEPSKITKSQVLTFFSLAISIFLDQVSFSVLAPFFPREAKDKGVSSLQIGFIFGAFALVIVIFSPIFGKFLPRLGAKFTFVSGIWIVAGCNILFGFCDEMRSTLMFVIFCYVIRCTAALGTAASVTASFTIAAQTFPDHVAQTIGLMETFGGLGYMVGPVIGGFLYEVGGQDYKIPFIVLGCADLVCVFLNLALLPPIVSEDRKTGSITQFLRIPSVWPVGLTIFVGSASFGFLDPTLSLHVEQFTQSAMIVGLLFLLAGGVYALSSPVWGWIAEKLNISRLMVIIGSIMSGGAFLLLGPSPLLNLPNEIWLICLSLFLCSVFLSASVICSFNDYLISALKNGLPDDMATQAVVSGIFNSLLALGNFVGPSVGGVVVHLYGFDWSSTVIGGIQVAVAIILALFTMVEFCYQQRRRSSTLTTRVMASVNREDLVQDSMEPLLKGRV